MNIRFLKIFAIVSALFFLSSCAVFIGDGRHHHRGYWHRYSSIEQVNSSTIQLAAQDRAEGQNHQQWVMIYGTIRSPSVRKGLC